MELKLFPNKKNFIYNSSKLNNNGILDRILEICMYLVYESHKSNMTPIIDDFMVDNY